MKIFRYSAYSAENFNEKCPMLCVQCTNRKWDWFPFMHTQYKRMLSFTHCTESGWNFSHSARAPLFYIQCRYSGTICVWYLNLAEQYYFIFIAFCRTAVLYPRNLFQFSMFAVAQICSLFNVQNCMAYCTDQSPCSSFWDGRDLPHPYGRTMRLGISRTHSMCPHLKLPGGFTDPTLLIKFR